MQKAYLTALSELAQMDRRVLSCLSDSGTEYDALFGRDFPEQLLNFGIAEENLVAAAAGLARCGKIPFVYTSGAFLAYRAYEFIRDDVCFQRSNVKLIGMGSGLNWSTLGPTHHTTEDVAVLRALPNLTFMSPASPLEVIKAVRAAYETEGPVYIRLGMKGERELYGGDYEFVAGKNIILQDGCDAAIFSTGGIVSEVLDAAELLAANGIGARVVNVHTLKPFDRESVVAAALETRAIFTVEEHTVSGGLGSMVAEVLAEEGLWTVFRRIGLSDRFASGYGTQGEVRKANGLDSGSIAAVIRERLRHIS